MVNRHTLHKHKIKEDGERQDTFNWSHDAAKSIIDGLLLFYNITESGKPFKSSSGVSYVYSREIAIPERLNSPYNFMVALHEIGHVICHDKRNSRKYKYNFICEYETEIFTINYAKNLGFIPNDHLTHYIEGAKDYVLDCLIKDIRKFNLDESSVNKKILKWLGVDFQQVYNKTKRRKI